ncbi:MAG: bifunctional UDP-3-O-[3-hydroxymyristoyl] N-acetylglucosamine deacetylase/3-hydroxyacyl-ACP dehydratase [Candidatus Eisenbacteria bacterium]|uniref:Multifunctional fusion protein n=1 Tax=Eiseniibacteriota bacterium TaxID=2212470 RepID=A0A948RV49_UNCEI|nr:bifunctional UDP-3-O-[3-hydroxymyristoyl] N-acetylglucosamine deacetylase/3-hydroxyacyl-ACP dehydratase [Candidatus Eisenbacteria bacterium]MBU1949231.1 bifunctional UDP-3-O-[3-hydroxymyristoyl] N-acetylglucosamine deacetylase/3-hydroxyacyl-ACP dehydratase [Candidatus Eisenbacteria bacterium]MBU2690269.1 bifunctional UDP-3-O-[3-hydroxymyristoyl] N-acetylglucosamine deacetylase/3-hydroxyacyl-ACP dehydratase [Candidatus Eisenbacteria bacterium]
MNVDRQKTLERESQFQGRGLHTGEDITARFLPAPPDTGVVFIRTDLPGQPHVKVCPQNALPHHREMRQTVLAAKGVEIHTVEHLLASITGLDIDNLYVELNGSEVPEPEDGSALGLVKSLRAGGIVEQDSPRRYVEIHQTTTVEDGAVSLVGLPYDGLRLSYTLQYENPTIGTQHMTMEITPEVYEHEIAPARTFALFEEVEKLRSLGLIKGGTLRNAVVVKGDEILSEEPLRFSNEFVRHKMLDLLGDLFLLGRPLKGHIIAVRSGHATNMKLARKIWESFEGPAFYDGLRKKTHFDIAAVTRIMPHRYPFLLVDRILYLEERERVIGLKNVTINEPFFQGHFTGHPVMPAVLIIEAMAQVGGVLLLHTVDDPDGKLVYFMGIDNAKFRRPVQPGDQLIFDLRMVRLKSRICKMTGRCLVDGQLVAEADLLSSIVDR